VARTFSTWKKVLAGLFLALALAAFSVIVYRVKAKPLEDVYASIKDQVAKTSQRHAENAWQFRYWQRLPYMRGKAAILDEKTGHVDSAHFKLQEELRASTPDEVGTIVLLTCTSIEVGRYAEPGRTTPSDAPGAYQWVCAATVIDRIIPAELDSEHFEGSVPPSRSSGPAYGNLPTAEIIKYLEGLPRRAMDWRPEEKQQTLYAPADGLSWIEFAVPAESEYLIQPERPLLLRLTDERQFVLFPDGRLTDSGGMNVFSLGDIPGSKLFLKAADRDVPAVKVTVSTRPK
jgi:hypothetical protein